MSAMYRSLVLLCFFAVLALGMDMPNMDMDCKFETKAHGKTYSYDLSPLKRSMSQGDYTANVAALYDRTASINVCGMVNNPCKRGKLRNSTMPAVCMETDDGDLSLGSADKSNVMMMPGVLGPDKGVSIMYMNGDTCVDPETSDRMPSSVMVNWICRDTIAVAGTVAYCTTLYANVSCQYYVDCYSPCACPSDWLVDNGFTESCTVRDSGAAEVGHVLLGILFLIYGLILNVGAGIHPLNNDGESYQKDDLSTISNKVWRTLRRAGAFISRLARRGDAGGGQNGIRRPLELAEATLLLIGGFAFLLGKVSTSSSDVAGIMAAVLLVLLGLWGLCFYYSAKFRVVSVNFASPAGFVTVGGLMFLEAANIGDAYAAEMTTLFGQVLMIAGALRALLAVYPKIHLLAGMTGMCAGVMLILTAPATIGKLAATGVMVMTVEFIVVNIAAFVALVEVAVVLGCCKSKLVKERIEKLGLRSASSMGERSASRSRLTENTTLDGEEGDLFTL